MVKSFGADMAIEVNAIILFLLIQFSYDLDIFLWQVDIIFLLYPLVMKLLF
jgi:hypothetical protein